VLPTYNRAHLLARSIDSALAQTRAPDEIIVVDDGSTDGTRELVGGYGDTLRYVAAPHRGVAATRNRGVAETDADFVAFLDSDDHWEPGYLDRMDQAITATDGRAWLYFANIRLAPQRDVSGSLWDACGFHPNEPFELRENGTDWVLLPRQPMMIPATVARREAYWNVGGQSVDLVSREDTHYFLNVGLAGPICAVATIAGEATADDAGRLTAQSPSQQATYWRCTRTLYADVLTRHPQMSSEARRTLRSRLADSYLHIGRAALRRRPISAVAHLVHAVYLDHRSVLERVRVRLSLNS
jgi:glycosyltransferase involved in cell wall biosynthesis